ncbi:carboxypeptidase regulatory-like domain-containing protein, partial [bacterium]|nr:carboxypeptidase regulatory-like domain-containing protein [bacterium]
MSGRVFFPDRQLYGGIPIFARDSTGRVAASVRTDEAGNFAFPALSPGLYDILATTGESEDVFAANIQITPGSQKIVGETPLLAVSNLVVDEIGTSTARITFTSNRASTSSVEYSSAVDSPKIAVIRASFGTTHQITLTGLTPQNSYACTLILVGDDGQKFKFPGIYITTTSIVGPTKLGITLSDGVYETRSKSIPVTIQAEGAAQMRLGESEDLSTVPWENFSGSRNVSLSTGDGTKRIYVQFKDANGNLSPVINDSILLTTSTSGYIGVWINKGQPLTNQTKVTLTLLFPGATQFMLSSIPDFLNSFWETFIETRQWTLSSGDGRKDVYAHFQGGGANPNDTFSTSITLVTTGPTVSMKVNDGASLTNSINVSLSFFNQTTPKDMQISNSSTFDASSTWLTYQSKTSWVLPTGDGSKTVYARFRDTIGNIFGPVASTIELDTKAPTNASFKIENGASTTTKLNVALSLSAEGAVQMVVSNSETFASATQEAFKTLRNWTLGGYGIQNVYVKFIDAASNTTSPITQSIEVLGSPASQSLIINDGDNSTDQINVRLSIFASEMTATNSIWLSNSGNFFSTIAQPYVASQNWLLDPLSGTKTVYIRFQNASGAYLYASDSIILNGPTNSTISTRDSQPITTGYVNLDLFALNAAQMLLTLDPSQLTNNALWVSYQAQYAMLLSPTGTDQIIYAKFRNTGLAETGVSSLSVKVTPPPPGSLTINGGDASTNQINVSLSLFASGMSASNSIWLSNDGNYSSAVQQSYAATKNWLLDPIAGVKTVFVRFQNASGTFMYASDTISLIGPASQTISTRDSQPITTGIVNLDLFAQNANQMLITLDPSRLSDGNLWIAYQSQKSLNLLTTGVSQVIYGKFRNLGLAETAVSSLTVSVSPPPPASLKINDDDVSTNQINVKLSLFASGMTATNSMWVSNTGNYSSVPSEFYVTTKFWDLDRVAGVKNVSVRFQNSSGTYFFASDTITLVGPGSSTISTRDVQPINAGYVNLDLYSPGATQMLITLDPSQLSNESLWSAYQGQRIQPLLPTGGNQIIYAKFRTGGLVETSVLTLSVSVSST